ncbi:hypothetical protein ACOT81_38680 [Streptomyces sp. WI04-05B]|uniref:Uncharacterized protein n=1 Tax=Streptomyces turgidiscabies (strain Car8) TaxID=698760 RepID=L7F273_STRT8|nr:MULTISPECIES: hypothetical protein [Streptomyces]ELP65728.1 hypothetical protein STRTUCAR8_01581 [Streptomyces turgidiscabies Car8]MDX2547526.1 hypothetical protein [Streptomyces sp. WI04-05B]MDX2589919.1 hypothetical protein [Streptomyces sp. WI04-05A]MDX3499792.1 hypothetical protein [Streptomyces turgidiscabies]
MYEKPDLDTPLAGLRSAFATEIAALAKKHKNSVRAQTVTRTGHTVLFTGMWGDHVGAIEITAPDGQRIRRADGWKIGKTAKVAVSLWDEMEQDRARAAERERLVGLKCVSITSADVTGQTHGRETGRYHLTTEQLAQVLALAERLAAANATE